MADLSTEDKIQKLLAISVVSDEFKKYWAEHLSTLNESQKKDLLEILESEQSLLQAEVDKLNQNAYQELKKDLGNTARTLNNSMRNELEAKVRGEEEAQLRTLEETLNNL
jgi:hypothetical protein